MESGFEEVPWSLITLYTAAYFLQSPGYTSKLSQWCLIRSLGQEVIFYSEVNLIYNSRGFQ